MKLHEGGQGRGPDEILANAMVVAVCLAAAAAIVILAVKLGGL